MPAQPHRTCAPILFRHIRWGAAGPVTDLALAGGRIAAVGARARDLPGTESVDATGLTALPGLVDAHVHSAQTAIERTQIDLSGCRSAAEAVDHVARAVHTGEARPRDGFVLGRQFRPGFWPDAPHRELLDAALPGVPVILSSADFHMAWASTVALDHLGFAGHPTGVLADKPALDAFARIPAATPAELDRWELDTMAEAARRGVTGVLDFELDDNLAAWARRAQDGPLPVRVAASVYPEFLDAAIAAGARHGDPVPGTEGLVTVGYVKIFADGSLNSRTARCLAPYPAAPGREAGDEPWRGALQHDPGDLVALMRAAAAAGLRPAVHAIGDEANRVALDAFETVGCAGRIEHAQLVDAADVPRFARAGLEVGVNPAHLLDDRDLAERYWAGRTDRAFPYADLARAGARLQFGSDSPVSPLDPWRGIAAAVARTGDDRPAWHPEQRLSTAQALTAASFGHDHLRVGDPADLAIVAGDPAGMDAGALRGIEVVATLVAGRFTHRRI